MHRKAAFRTARAPPALDSGNRDAIQPLTSRRLLASNRGIRTRGGSPPNISFQADFHHDAGRSFPYGQCDSRPRHGRRREGQIRPSRPADGRRRHRHRAVHAVPEIRRRRSKMAGPRPFRAFGRARLDAAVCAAVSHRQQGHDARRRSRTSGSSARKTPGHPENFETSGVETTTGPLGQGIATSVGMALAEKMLAAEFGKKIVGHHTYVLASDGDLMEGVSQEAIAMAGHWKLNKLIVLYDDNGISIDGPTSIAELRRSGEALQVRRLGRRTDRRPRSEGHCSGDHARAEIQQAVADRLQDHDRLRRTDQGRHRQGPWRSARRRRTEGRQAEARHFAGRLFGAGRRVEGLARGRQPRRRGAQGMGRAIRRARKPQARRIRTPHAPRTAGLVGEGAEGAQEGIAGDAAEYRHPQIVRTGDRGDRAGDAGISGRLRRSHRLQQQQGEIRGRLLGQDAEGPLHPLRHPRARHGGGHERHLPAWRIRAERRHLPGVHRLCPPGDAAGGADGRRRGLCDDPRFDRPRRRRADPSAGRASRGAARHPQYARVPSLRRGRGGGVLGAGARTGSTARRCWR